MKNVFLDLQSRQWRQVEGWNVRQLGQFSEEKALLGLRECVSSLSNLSLMVCSFVARALCFYADVLHSSGLVTA